MAVKSLQLAGTMASKVSLIQPGQYIIARRQFTKDIVDLFSKVSLDLNPIHMNKEYAVDVQGFDDTVVHGMLCSSMFSAMFASRLPGSIYRAQSLSFHSPVFVGNTVQAKVEVIQVRKLRHIFLIKCDTTINLINDEEIGDLAIKGRAEVVINSRERDYEP
mmetsp:Transcript_7764/g.10156  ORF Transcript_7764/g.10156 Transcript_7764/m.10156 type:complete len:161 (+) Transcript_7764:165-647(+)